jgi:plasmid stability protein
MMPISLSVKNVPNEIAEKLKMQARQNHRSLQGELRAILEEAVSRRPKMSLAEIYAEVERDGFSTPSEAADIIRADRDSH